jgi:hypothetical protein
MERMNPVDQNEPIIEQHESSGRTAVFEDDGISAWLYLTKGGTPDIAGDCWLYNRVPAPPPSEIDNYRDGPPPAFEGFTTDDDVYTEPALPAIEFVWSKTGNDVAAKVNGIILGFVSSSLSSGYSRRLLKDGPWGRVWNERIFEALFAKR